MIQHFVYFKLRYLQTLNSISAENNSTVIFPVPIDIMNSFMQMNNNNQPHQMMPPILIPNTENPILLPQQQMQFWQQRPAQKPKVNNVNYIKV